MNEKMTPSIRIRLGRAPFALSLNIPIMDIVGAVAGLIEQGLQQVPEEPAGNHQLPVVEKYLHILVHGNGEVDIPASTQQEAIEAAQKVLKQVHLVGPKLYRVQGDFRVLVGDL